MNETTVAKIYTVATLLCNCHVCLYGSISSNYFDIELPVDMLTSYLIFVIVTKNINSHINYTIFNVE
jgi:hypothetical protein